MRIALILLLVLTACQKSGNNVEFVKQPDPPTITPVPPQGQQPTPTLAKVTITWEANSEADMAGYKIYMSMNSTFQDPPVVLGLVTTYTVENITRGRTYYFAVSAFDTSGNESEKSETRQITIPMETR